MSETYWSDGNAIRDDSGQAIALGVASWIDTKTELSAAQNAERIAVAMNTHARGELEPRPRLRRYRVHVDKEPYIWDTKERKKVGVYGAFWQAEAACAKLNAEKPERCAETFYRGDGEWVENERVKDLGRFFADGVWIKDRETNRIIHNTITVVDKEGPTTVASVIASALSKAYDRRAAKPVEVADERKGERRKTFMSGRRAYDDMELDAVFDSGRRTIDNRRKSPGTPADRKGGE